jgi:hypothetical protein
MFVLPSYVVKFEVEDGRIWSWRVNTDEGLEAFCKVLRLNGIIAYSVREEKR